MITNRLKQVVGKVVPDFQCSFAKKRQVLDANLIAIEVTNSRLKSFIPSIISKLDIKKAYDCVNWSFHLALMEKMGFGQKREGCIKWCISLSYFLVLVN